MDRSTTQGGKVYLPYTGSVSPLTVVGQYPLGTQARCGCRCLMSSIQSQSKVSLHDHHDHSSAHHRVSNLSAVKTIRSPILTFHLEMEIGATLSQFVLLHRETQVVSLSHPLASVVRPKDLFGSFSGLGIVTRFRSLKLLLLTRMS